MTNPFYDPYRILSKIYSDGAHLKIALAETDIEESNRARTVKTVYGVLENDGYLSLCIKTFAPKSPKQAVRILLKIALYYIIFLDKPRYMATDTAVDLCKKLGKGGMAGFLNAFLRTFDESKVHLPQDEAGLSVKYNYPLFAVRKLLEQYGERAEEIMSAKSRGVTVRFVHREETYLSRPHEKTPFPHVYIFPHFIRDEGFNAGDYTFQSVGSVAICNIVEPCRRMLDACAAPGGKSVFLAEKCGSVLSCELHEHRVALIESYVRRMGVENVTVLQADSTLYHTEWRENFDGVLCDVPCSGLGTVAENPDLSLHKEENDLKGLNDVQYSILENCSRYVKAGGALYYSTCSILQEENDGIVSKFTEGNPNFTCEMPDSPMSHEKMSYGIQFLPDRAFGAGFYIAKLRRKL